MARLLLRLDFLKAFSSSSSMGLTTDVMDPSMSLFFLPRVSLSFDFLSRPLDRLLERRSRDFLSISSGFTSAGSLSFSLSLRVFRLVDLPRESLRFLPFKSLPLELDRFFDLLRVFELLRLCFLSSLSVDMLKRSSSSPVNAMSFVFVWNKSSSFER